MRILVVDDDRAVRESLRRSLSFNGYEVDLAADGAAAALGQIATTRPDALVLDVMMPRMGGLEACRALRATGDDVPILVLTARDAVADRVAGLDAGADDYLPKPFALVELLARLRALHAPFRQRVRRGRPGPPGLRRPVDGPRHPRGAPRRPPDGADPHRVHAARDVPAPPARYSAGSGASSRRCGSSTSPPPRTPSRSTSGTCVARPRAEGGPRLVHTVRGVQADAARDASVMRRAARPAGWWSR